jgi:hypothetical protein
MAAAGWLLSSLNSEPSVVVEPSITRGVPLEAPSLVDVPAEAPAITPPVSPKSAPSSTGSLRERSAEPNGRPGPGRAPPSPTTFRPREL